MSTQTVTETKVKLARPKLHNVLLLNDDFTPQNYVIDVLIQFFNKSPAEAYDLMMQVHRKGRGIAGTYTSEIAEQKVIEVNQVSRHHGHPLKTISEPQP